MTVRDDVEVDYNEMNPFDQPLDSNHVDRDGGKVVK